MSIWAVGDLQGCCDALDQLLAHPTIVNDKEAKFWFAGDLTNRGPYSLQTIRRLMGLGSKAVCILGNHDLHILVQIAKKNQTRPSPTVQEILSAPDALDIINWLRYRPLAHLENEHLMVHAGVLPDWTASAARLLAAEVEHQLQSDDWEHFLLNVFGNTPDIWDDALIGFDRARVIINALTRLRFCTPEGMMEFDSKGDEAPKGFVPWFKVKKRLTQAHTIVFGHWSTLGLINKPHLIGLDTGCVWGGQLTAMNLSTRDIVQIQCRKYKDEHKKNK